MNIDIYVIKSEHLKERCKMLPQTLETIQSIMKKNNFIVKIIPIIGPTISDIENNLDTYNANINLNNDEIEDIEFKKAQTKFSIAQLSNLYKHRKAYEMIKSSTTKHNYIVEDDIILLNEYVNNFIEFIKLLPTIEYDIILTCLSNNNNNEKKIDIIPSTLLFKQLLTKSSYLITPITGEKLYNFFNIIRFPMKLSLSKFIFDNKDTISSYILNKHTLFEGSKLGIFTTSVNASNNLIQNNCYINLLELAKKDANLNEIETYYNTYGKNNPDFQHIMGLVYYKHNKLQKATEILKSAVINFKNQDGYIVQYNEIINNCINIYKYYQDDIKDCLTKKGIY
jgi:hypothetical protein